MDIVLKSQEDECTLVRDIVMESDDTGLGLYVADLTEGKLENAHVLCCARLCKDIRSV